MAHGLPGTFAVIDGLDGIGKGVAIASLVAALRRTKLRVFNLEDFWKEHHDHPEFDPHVETSSGHYVNLDDFDVLVSAEPTFVGIGMAIRNEVIAKNDRAYSAHVTAELYAADRLLLYRRVVLPALQAGKHVVQSRCVSTSLVYQSHQSVLPGEKPLSLEEIAMLEGNTFALSYAPDLLIIPTVPDPNELMERLQRRKKQDRAIFENVIFQQRIKPVYEGSELRNIFESRGTEVRYIDASVSVRETRRQAVAAYASKFSYLFS